MSERSPVYFFMHIMKTGGTTFGQHIAANFTAEQRYPDAPKGPTRREQYAHVDGLLALTPEQRARIRIYQGHFPFIASEVVGADVTMALVRHPVDRTVSYLRQCKRHRPHMRDMTLEEIYGDAWMFPLYIRDYQAKLFSLTSDETNESHMTNTPVDEDRLAVALEHLARVDVLGLTERSQDFVDDVRRRFGWNIGDVPDARVSDEGWDVSAAFRDRIASDNAMDMAFYERAVKLVAERALT